MIKIENAEVFGWEAAIRGMRNPMNSWELSDSELCPSAAGFEDCTVSVLGKCPRHDDYFKEEIFCVGQNDMKLMKNLVKAGTDHSKFMRMIHVQMDVTAPLYWWKEMDTYKVGTVSNSCSTMHKIHKKEFTLNDFSVEHLMYDRKSASELADVSGKATNILVTPKSLLEITIGCLNNYRKMFLETKDKNWWWQMIQLLPSSYNQLRSLDMNYAVLRNIYHSRKNHKLDEWVEFCKLIEMLPYSELITC